MTVIGKLFQAINRYLSRSIQIKFDWSTAGNESCIVFFGLSALDKKINFTVGVTLLAAKTIVQSKISPFKCEYKNVNDFSNIIIILISRL